EPFADRPCGHQSSGLFDQHARAGGAELGDADVFAVGLVGIEGLADLDHAAAADADFHLFVAVALPARPGDQQRVPVPRGQQVAQHLIVEEHVAVQHHTAVEQQVAGQPQRIEAVGRRVARVHHYVDAGPAAAPDVGGAIAGDDGDRVDAARPQRTDLP